MLPASWSGQRRKTEIVGLTISAVGRLGKKKSDPEIQDRFFRIWSGKRDSNSRRQPWQGCTLPLSYSRDVVLLWDEYLPNPDIEVNTSFGRIFHLITT